MSAVEILERVYIPTPQPNPLFELAPGEEIILVDTDESLNAEGFLKEIKKIKNRYHLIGMTKRQYDYLVAANSFQKQPGLPFVTNDRIAEELNKSSFTTYTIRKEMIEAGYLIIRHGAMPGGDERVVWLHDFTPAYQMIKALDNPEKMREAQAVYLKKMLERSERARRAGKQRWKNAGYYDNPYQDNAAQSPYEDEMHNGQNAMLNQRVDPAVSLSTRLSTEKLNRDEYRDHHTEDNDTSRFSKTGKEEFSNSQSPTDYTNRTGCENSLNSNPSTSQTAVEHNTNRNRNIEPPPLEEKGAAQTSNKRITNYKMLMNTYGKAEESLTQIFKQVVEDFSLELNDEAPKSTLTQVNNIYKPLIAQRITSDSFIALLYASRDRAKATRMESRTADGWHIKRMPYFIEDLAKRALDTLEQWRKEDEEAQQNQGSPYDEGQ